MDNSDSSQIMNKILKYRKSYPKICNIYIPAYFLKKSPKAKSILDECNICLKSPNEVDSISANVLKSEYFIENRDFNSFDTMYYNFSMAEKNRPTFEELYVWERSEFYKLKLSALYINDNYFEFIRFTKSIKMNDFIPLDVIENENSFKKLIMYYFNKYPKNESNFEQFYVDHFNKHFK